MTEDSVLKLALKARAVRHQVRTALNADPVAVVGIGCRLPGAVSGPDDFWRLLSNGGIAVGRVPDDRWNGDALFHPDLAAPGKSITRHAAFLDRIDAFDADYFSILPREAEQMDPQQRLLLEVAIEALDDAGLPHNKLARTRTGVFIASYHNDYARLTYDDLDRVDLRTLTGTLHSVVPNRLSWFLDLRGPSVSIDTACSSSLVALHLACQSLRFGETDLALAGGVSLIVTPDLMVSMSKVGFMSPDGRSKAFDAAADGFGRGEGCGVVVLKRLSDALADDDRILAVLRATAVNQDGRSTVMAAPSGPAQELLVREALENAQIDPGRITFVEAHGTGTALGDPIEVEALSAAIGRVPNAPTCMLGSAKANIGHLEAAAGVTGLIKTILALQHEAIPPQPNFSALNPHIDLSGTRLAVATSLETWPRGDIPRVAAVSSFGVGGTNAHAIVEEAPQLASASQNPPSGRRARLLPLSAKTPTALQDLVSAWSSYLSSTDATPADFCRTAGERRTHYSVRRAAVGKDATEFAKALSGVASERIVPSKAPSRPRVGFVFCGQGPQWHAMGRELLEAEPVFSAAMEACDAALTPWSGWSVRDELMRSEDSSRLGSTEIAQPALFALQVALSAQLEHWGIRPDAVVGHSVGEIAALHVAGFLDLQEAARIVWRRGQSMQQATGRGRMASASLSEEEAIDLLAEHPTLDIAAVNALRNVVLSGPAAQLDKALAQLKQRGVAYRRLPVDYAFHGAQMEPSRAELERELGAISVCKPRIEVFSTVTGARLSARDIDVRYIGRNVRETVRFEKAVQALLGESCDLLVEVGPHPVLRPSLEDIASSAKAAPRIVSTLRRGHDERAALLGAVAAAYEVGCDPDWAALADGEGSVTPLPRYPWQRKRYWVERTSRPSAWEGKDTLHPILGRAVRLAGGNWRVFEGTSQAVNDWLGDHRLFGRAVLPGAVVMEALYKAALLVGEPVSAGLARFAMDRPVLIPEHGEVRWQVVAETGEAGSTTLAFFVEDADAPDGWIRVATANTIKERDDRPSKSLRTDSESPVSAEWLYGQFEEKGVQFGPRFRLLQDIMVGPGRAWARLAPVDDSHTGFLLSPTVLDAALQLCTAAASAYDAVYLPVAAERIEFKGRPDGALAAVAEASMRGDVLSADIEIVAEDGTVVARIQGVTFARGNARILGAGPAVETYVERWIEAPPAEGNPEAGGLWLVYDDAAAICSRALASVTTGATLWVVRPGETLEQVGPGRLRLSPLDPEQARTLLESPPWGPSQLRGIVHGWSLDADALADDLDNADAMAMASLLHLVQAARNLAAPLRVVTRGAFAAPAEGGASSIAGAGTASLAQIAAIENAVLRVGIIDVDPTGVEHPELGRECLADGPGTIALRSGRRLSPRLSRLNADPGLSDQAPIRLSVERPGDLDGLKTHPARALALAPDELRIRVASAGLNFRDVLTTLGMYPGEAPPLGVECVGEVIERGRDVTGIGVGDRVFGYAPGCLATEVTTRACFVIRAPQGLEDDQAATLAVAFGTAIYGLERLARLRAGEHVLIHAAAGGVGLAAVQIAKTLGCVVHATCSATKRERLRAMDVDFVYDSRSLDFADQILENTNGRGVDVILNSLAGPFVDASFRCLAKGGRFLEIGKRDVWSPEQAASQRPDASYCQYDLGQDAERDRSLFPSLLDELCRRLADGSLRPLPVRPYPLARIGEAMRTMALARHVGKIAIRIGRGGATFQAAPDGAYLITGGLGALGLESAEWLLRAGARFIVLSSRRAPDQNAERRIEALRASGADIRVESCDAGDASAMADLLLRFSRDLPPLRGVIHAAGVLDDGMLENQTWTRARRVLEGKAHGARILDGLTRDLELDFFVLFSAGAVLLGGVGQGLYPAANAQLDAVARDRAASGRPALSVAWGLWAGAGMASGRAGSSWAARGVEKLDPSRAFAELERLLASGRAHGAILAIDWVRFASHAPVGLELSYFADVVPRRDEAQRQSRSKPEPNDLIKDLRAVRGHARMEALSAFVRERAVEILGLDPAEDLDPRRPLKEYGIDSLMGVELRNILVRAGGEPLPATLLFDYPTLDGVCRYLLGVWHLNDTAAAPVGADPVEPRATELEALSNDEVEDLLRRELAMAGGAA